MKPKSLFDSPPQEYVALHQQGNWVGSDGSALAIVWAGGTRSSLRIEMTQRCQDTLKSPGIDQLTCSMKYHDSAHWPPETPYVVLE